MSANELKIDCTQCQHYYITWDASRPYGCKFFAFKAPYSPAQVVIESSGKPCEAFEQKQLAMKKVKTEDKRSGWVA